LRRKDGMKTPTPLRLVALAAATLLIAGCASSGRTQEKIMAAREAEPTVSPGAKFALLPAAVQKSIRAHAGTSDIADIDKIPGDDHDVYAIRFRDNPKLYIAENGDLVKPEDVGGLGAPAENFGAGSGGSSATNMLPYAVRHTLQRAAPNAPLADVQRQRRTVYEFTFKDSQRHPKIVIADDGTILKEPPY
jgi:hypothetical protein